MPGGPHAIDERVGAALPQRLAFAQRPTGDELRALPGCAAVYLFLAAGEIPVQLATTQHLRRLAISRLADPTRETRGKADLAEVVRSILWRPVATPFEARWWYYQLARQLYPKRYRHMISFGPAWFLRVDWTERVPELRITKHVWEESGAVLGPWLTHDLCQKALEGLWDLFDLCRFPEQVRQAPGGQRCVYAEMGRCDAPCDGSAPLADYGARVRAAWDFACGPTRPWIDAAQQRMKEAAQAQQFERAGLLKKQIAWAWRWHDQVGPTVTTRELLNCLLLMPATRRKAWRLFLFVGGDLLEGPIFTQRKLVPRTAAWLAETLVAPRAQAAADVRTEQTWLLAHFRRSKGGDASVIVDLPDLTIPPDFEAHLGAEMLRLRASSASDQAGMPLETAGPPADGLESPT